MSLNFWIKHVFFTLYLLAHSPSEDPTCAVSRPPECWPIVRGTAMSKTDDLRAELLRSEHRKAELQWDENLAASR